MIISPRKKQALVQKELEEAASEAKQVNLPPTEELSMNDNTLIPCVTVHCIVPTTASQKLVL